MTDYIVHDTPSAADNYWANDVTTPFLEPDVYSHIHKHLPLKVPEAA